MPMSEKKKIDSPLFLSLLPSVILSCFICIATATQTMQTFTRTGSNEIEIGCQRDGQRFFIGAGEYLDSDGPIPGHASTHFLGDRRHGSHDLGTDLVRFAVWNVVHVLDDDPIQLEFVVQRRFLASFICTRRIF